MEIQPCCSPLVTVWPWLLSTWAQTHLILTAYEVVILFCDETKALRMVVTSAKSYFYIAEPRFKPDVHKSQAYHANNQ